MMSASIIPRVLTVEGNIGTGKTSLLKAAAQAFGHKVVVLFEPLNQWTGHYCDRTKKVHNFLQRQYEEPRASFSFQVYVMNCMTKRIATALDDQSETDKFILLERGPLSCLEVFTEVYYAQGLLTDTEMAILYHQGEAFVKVVFK